MNRLGHFFGASRALLASMSPRQPAETRQAFSEWDLTWPAVPAGTVIPIIDMSLLQQRAHIGIGMLQTTAK